MEPFAPADWRLVVDDEPRTGAANMAVDQAMAEACAAGTVPPTLRFYRWQPPAISLGRHQPLSDVEPGGRRAPAATTSCAAPPAAAPSCTPTN